MTTENLTVVTVTEPVEGHRPPSILTADLAAKKNDAQSVTLRGSEGGGRAPICRS
jgi:hypothetical protein